MVGESIKEMRTKTMMMMKSCSVQDKYFRRDIVQTGVKMMTFSFLTLQILPSTMEKKFAKLIKFSN